MMNEIGIIENPLDRLLECQFERINETDLKVTLPIQPLILNPIGIVHGGIICSLADIAMGQAQNENNKQAVVTVDLKTTFIKGAKGKYLIAEAYLVKKGRTLNHYDCFIYNENNELVAKTNGIFAKV